MYFWKLSSKWDKVLLEYVLNPELKFLFISKYKTISFMTQSIPLHQGKHTNLIKPKLYSFYYYNIRQFYEYWIETTKPNNISYQLSKW